MRAAVLPTLLVATARTRALEALAPRAGLAGSSRFTPGGHPAPPAA